MPAASLVPASLQERIKSIPWMRIFLWSRLIGWELFAIGFLAVCCINSVAEGIKLLVSSFGQKFYKQPWGRWAENLEFFSELSVAQIAAFALLMLVSAVWPFILFLYLRKKGAQSTQHWDEDANTTFLSCVGGALLLCDLAFMYCGLKELSWGSKSWFSFNALIATGMYCSAIVCVAYVTLNLHKPISDLKTSETPKEKK